MSAAGPAAPSTRRDLAALVRLVGLRPVRFAAAALLGAAAVLAGVALLALSGYLIARASQQPPILSLTVLVVTVRALALGRPLARYGERLVSHDVAFRTLGRVRATLFERIEPLAPAELDEYRDGELLSRLVRDVDEMQDLVLRVLLPVAVALLAVPVVVLGFVWVSPPAAAAVAVGLVVVATVVPAIAHRMTARGQAQRAELRGALTAELVDALDAAPELWLCGAEDAARRRVEEADGALVDAALADARGSGWADGLAVVASGATALTVLGLTSAAAASGSLDPLVVAPLTMAAIGAFEAVTPLGQAARHVGAVAAAGRRLLGLAARRPGVVEPMEPAPPPPRGPGPDVAVRDLTVDRGHPAQRALDGLDLDLPTGGRLVVTGPSGSGKSTLLAVLVRFLERSGGSVRLGGVDVRSYAQHDVRRQVLLGEQDPHVFDSTIRANVVFARPGADDDEVLAALDRAQLGAWVRALPDGLDTLVGERGRTLSGGQRQRLGLARAFLADPGVLLLDEPTAHLDAATARALLDDVWRTAGDRSVLLVSHADPGPFAASPSVLVARGPAGPAGSSPERGERAG